MDKLDKVAVGTVLIVGIIVLGYCTGDDEERDRRAKRTEATKNALIEYNRKCMAAGLTRQECNSIRKCVLRGDGTFAACARVAVTKR